MMQKEHSRALKGIRKQLFILDVVREVGILDGCDVVN